MAGRHVAVVVLGDIGRSPRMQYHCRSLANMDAQTRVSFIGYEGEACIADVEQHPRIDKIRIAMPCKKWPRRLYLLWAPLKALLLVLHLLYILVLSIRAPSHILVQNPPSIPTLLICWIVARLRGARLVIDWHNFGYTILGSNTLGPGHVLVKVARWYERLLGRCGDGHLCVTAAMRDWLDANWGIRPRVMYDKAPEFFRPMAEAEQHELFTRLAGAFGGENPFTSAAGGGRLRDGRPALLISSTSWTPDEDFSILLDALVQFDRVSNHLPDEFPEVVAVVTGKGPEKAMYQRRIAELNLKRVRILTMWLEADDYPKLLGSADLGICLHTSTSGLDLPMKVVDMFGCQLPVCAVGFRCLPELVRHGRNGMVFQDATQLSRQLQTLLRGFPANEQLAALRAGVAESQGSRWDANWTRVAAPEFA